MKKLAIFLIVFLNLFAYSCKKSTPAAINIVGKWSFSNISGTYSYNLTPSTGSLTTYTYNTSSDILTETTTYPTLPTSIATYQINSEIWTFNSDNSYTINEIYITSPGSNLPETSSVSGTWKYQNRSDDTVYLSAGASYVLGNVTNNMNSNLYAIQMINKSDLQLGMSTIPDTVVATSTNVTLTFTKQ